MNASRQRLGCLSAVVLSIGTVAFGIHLVLGSYDRLFRSLVPMSGSTYSTSLKPYKISLRSRETSEYDGHPTSKVDEWSLTVPLAFVTYELGSNGSEHYFGDKGNTEYFVRLEGLVDLQRGLFEPVSPTVTKDSLKQHSAVVFLSNLNWPARLGGGKACFQNPVIGGCVPPADYCPVILYFKGWKVKVAIPIDQYGKYMSFCSVVDDFFVKFTTHIDLIEHKKIVEYPNGR